MAVAIGYALQSPPLVLFSLITVGFCLQCHGRRRRSAGSLCHCHYCSRAWQSSFKGDKDRYSCHAAGYDRGGYSVAAGIAPALGAAAMKIGALIMGSYESAAVFDGNRRIRACGNCTYASNLFRCDLCSLWTDRACRRCGCGRMLCADGRICGYVF